MHGLRVNTGEGKRQRQREGLYGSRVDLPDSSAGEEREGGEGGPFMVKKCFLGSIRAPRVPGDTWFCNVVL